MFTKIESLDKYLALIGVSEQKITAIWEQGSYLEGISDEYSDRDFVVIWDHKIPYADIRIKAAENLGFVIHEIKDVEKIGKSFDLFEDKEDLINIGHATKVREEEWYSELETNNFHSGTDQLLMSASALCFGKIYFQKDNWIYQMKEKVKLSEQTKHSLIKYYGNKTSQELVYLHKSAKRDDLIPFLKYLKRIIRNLQLIYLIGNDHPVVSPKIFKQRFAIIENAEITELIRNISSIIDMNKIYKNTLDTASGLGIDQSEKYKA